MKVISFSLYGDNPKYWVGAKKNAELAKKFYPSWVPLFWINFRKGDRIARAQSYQIPEWCPPMMARFLVADWPGVERFIVRDCDSRLSQREADAVKEWEESDLILHVIRDHPSHYLIPGGMFGIQCKRDNWRLPSMEKMIKNFIAEHPNENLNEYGWDQKFLAQKIWPMLGHSSLHHDSIRRPWGSKNMRPLPPRTNWPRFIGEVYDENDVPRDGDWQQVPKE